MQQKAPLPILQFLLIAFLSCLAGGQDQQPAATGQFDGPAELPRLYVKSALADTPTPGKTMQVKNSNELRSAIEKASCGDTIKLQAGVVFPGNFKFPAKPCDDAHWIVLRTSASDSDLPPEGTRAGAGADFVPPLAGGRGPVPPPLGVQGQGDG